MSHYARFKKAEDEFWVAYGAVLDAQNGLSHSEKVCLLAHGHEVMTGFVKILEDAKALDAKNTVAPLEDQVVRG